MMTYRSNWIKHLNQEIDYYSTLPEHFQNWERNSKPEMMANHYLSNALSVLYADGGMQLAEKFFRATIELVDRAFEEDRFHAKYAEYGLPRNQGRALRVKTYANALTGQKLDTAALIQASQYYIEWCSDWKGADWDSQAQSDYIVGVRLLLIADHVEGARELLKTRRSFKWHEEEYSLLQAIANEAERSVPIENEELHQQILVFFDRIRNPDFEADVFFDEDTGRFEWGVLIHKYFTPGGQIDWQAVIDSISR